MKRQWRVRAMREFPCMDRKECYMLLHIYGALKYICTEIILEECDKKAYVFVPCFSTGIVPYGLSRY